MDRRGFLGSILALGAAPAIVRADSLMRVVLPTAQEITLITTQGNSILTVEIIAREALRLLNENMKFCAKVNAEWDDWKGADTITIRRPALYERR